MSIRNTVGPGVGAWVLVLGAIFWLAAISAASTTGDPGNRCELSRVYLRTGDDLQPAAATPVAGCGLLTDERRDTEIALPEGTSLELQFIGAPRWLNRISVEADGAVAIAAWKSDGTWIPLGTADAGVLATADLFLRGLRFTPAGAEAGNFHIADVEARFEQVDPDHGGSPLLGAPYLLHYDWVNDYPWTSDLSKCDDDAHGLRDHLTSSWGYTGHGNSSAHEHHFVINGLGSGSNSYHVDWADLSYFAGHGSGSVYDGGYGVNYGSMRFGIAFDGTALNPSEALGAWGNQNMEWLMATSCQTLNSASWAVWGYCFNGQHLFCGASSNVNDKDYGSAIGRKLVDSGIFDSAKKVKTAFFNSLDYRNYHGQAVVLGETSGCGNDYIWGQGSVSSDPVPDGYYSVWTRTLNGIVTRDQTTFEENLISHPERYHTPIDPVVFPKTGPEGFEITVDRSLLEKPAGLPMPSYEVVPVVVDSGFVRDIADRICTSGGILCGGDIGPTGDGEMNLIIGDDELTVNYAGDHFNGAHYVDAGDYLLWRSVAPSVPDEPAALAIAYSTLTDWLPGGVPADAFFDRVDYLNQAGISMAGGAMTVDPESTYVIESRALFERRLGAESYPVVGGCKLSVTLGDGGKVDRLLQNGWRPLTPAGSVTPIDVGSVLGDLNAYGWAACIDGIRLPADELVVTDWELGYYEPGAGEDVDFVRPVYILRALAYEDGVPDPTPVEVYTWAEHLVLKGRVLSPPDSTTVPSGTTVCLEAQGLDGAGPYSFEWRDEDGIILGTGSFLCTPVNLPVVQDEPCAYARTFEVVVHDAEGNEASDQVRIYLSDFASVEGGEPPASVDFALEPNTPNPFTDRTLISYRIPYDGHGSVDVRLRIYDVSGRLVRTLVDGQQSASRHTVAWDGTDDRGRRVASGMYFSRLEAAGLQATGQLSLIR